MSDLMKSGAQWLNAMRNQHATQMVTYQRGDDEVALLATIGRTVFDVQDEVSNAVVRIISRDFLITAADLILDGEPVEPAKGDKIIETAGGKIYTHEVLAPGDEPPFRWSDASRTTLRIHTKQISVADDESTTAAP